MEYESIATSRGRILVVDDSEAQVEIIVQTLGHAYDISVALDGETALQVAGELQPDLILLDIVMPGMDGYEVCRQLKANQETRDIDIIFLTGLATVDDEIRGLQLGGADFITKPFNTELLKVRVGRQLALKSAGRKIVEQRDKLETALDKLRQLELLREDLLHMIVHDLRSPLSIIMGFIEAAARSLPESPEFSDCREDLQIASTFTRQLNEMISTILDINRIEADKMPLKLASIDLREVVTNALGRVAEGDRVIFRQPPTPIIAFCDRGLTERIAMNLLNNALKFTPDHGTVTISLAHETPWIQLDVTDTGIGIPREEHDRIFEKFGIVAQRNEGKQCSTGLGLAFCKLAVEAQSGSIRVQSEPGLGSTFQVLLPSENKHPRE